MFYAWFTLGQPVRRKTRLYIALSPRGVVQIHRERKADLVVENNRRPEETGHALDEGAEYLLHGALISGETLQRGSVTTVIYCMGTARDHRQMAGQRHRERPETGARKPNPERDTIKKAAKG